MAIDLNACIGCNACVVACQAENNIPVVGKEQVHQGPRDALDPHRPLLTTASSTTPDDVLPAGALHALRERALRIVCPVGATVHDAEGLNDMVYNRCVGTRYCSNNCPYKVRRFNFFHLHRLRRTASLKLHAQPRRHRAQPRRDGEVHLLRAAHQRRARSTPKSEDRPIRDGEIVTACQAACPAEAIVFGDINDTNSRVAKLKAIRATTVCWTS